MPSVRRSPRFAVYFFLKSVLTGLELSTARKNLKQAEERANSINQRFLEEDWSDELYQQRLVALAHLSRMRRLCCEAQRKNELALSRIDRTATIADIVRRADPSPKELQALRMVVRLATE